MRTLACPSPTLWLIWSDFSNQLHLTGSPFLLRGIENALASTVTLNFAEQSGLSGLLVVASLAFIPEILLVSSEQSPPLKPFKIHTKSNRVSNIDPCNIVKNRADSSLQIGRTLVGLCKHNHKQVFFRNCLLRNCNASFGEHESV